jgi:biotin carboxyl carrier protein
MPPRRITLAYRDHEHAIEVLDEQRLSVDGQVIELHRDPLGTVRFNGRPGRAWTAADGKARWVYLDGRVYEFRVQGVERETPSSDGSASREKNRAADAVPKPRSTSKSAPGSLAAPMPATVRRVVVSPGDAVKRGETVIILEAMKMELPVRAPADGRVAAVRCREGDLVDAGETLVVME